MAIDDKLQAIFSDETDLNRLPTIVPGFFYVIIIDRGWPTMASKVVKECISNSQKHRKKQTYVAF